MRTLLLVSVLSLGACARPNDLPHLQDDVVAVVKLYQPRLDALGKRIDLLNQRGATLPQGTSGIAEAAQLLGRARDKLAALRTLVAPVPTEADKLAKDGDADGLARLGDEIREQLDQGVTEATDEIGAVESWIAQSRPAPATPVPPTTPTEMPAPAPAR